MTDLQKYYQALNRQKFHRGGNVVVQILRLPDRYRYICHDGTRLDIDLQWGIEHHPIALCARDE